MKTFEVISKRFNELAEALQSVRANREQGDETVWVDPESWQTWSTCALNILINAFGAESVHYQNLKKIYDEGVSVREDFLAAKGVFLAAKADFEGGYVFNLETSISGEIFGDFVALAKQALSENQKDVAAVLACAALEDALKRYARAQGLSVDDSVMQQVVAGLKSKGLVGGAQKTLLDTMPKIRDYAMHANWEKLSPADVNSVIGFVEQFVLSHF